MTGRHHRVGEHQRRRADLLEGVAVAVERELAQRPDQRRARAAEHREHRARHLRRPLEIEDPELLPRSQLRRQSLS